MRKKNVKLWNNLTKQLKDFEISAGWFENSRYDDNTPIANGISGYLSSVIR